MRHMQFLMFSLYSNDKYGLYCHINVFHLAFLPGELHPCLGVHLPLGARGHRTYCPVGHSHLRDISLK